ncbi:MAG TPA: FAD-linked oxidase C-terminal domain-containing protein, partial [Cytophagaceae bacterium]
NKFNTAIPSDYVRFENEENELFAMLKNIREKILKDEALEGKIRDKYRTKNTMGYSVNSFIDYVHPLDIISHLLIGSEGTLGFIEEAVLKTIPDYPYKSTVLLYFPDIYSACSAIVPLKESGAEALELMDRAALRSIQNLKGVPAEIPALPDSAAALLCEYPTETLELLNEKKNIAYEDIKKLNLLNSPIFTEDPYEQAFLWKLRKGMFPSVGAVRQQGTSVILEDIAFPIEVLAPAVDDLQKLFQKHEYDNAIIFGHAKDGNLHFVVSQSFNSKSEIEKYDLFMQDVVSLVIDKYRGTLKAEHGTGRNMAPFVETEWGPEVYAIMKQVKSILDPKNILNPGVIINEDARAHLKNLKSLPIVEAEVDKCIECGYCEHRCPSRDITLTPRQRIVVRREMARLSGSGDTENYRKLAQEYQYDGMDTCAVDGLCATDCPVNINTGDLIKRLRRENHSQSANNVAMWVSRNFSMVENLTNMALSTGHFTNKIFGKKGMGNLTKGLKAIIPAFPLWIDNMGKPVRVKPINNSSAEYLYFSTCITRTMGQGADGESVYKSLLNLCNKAGISLKTVEKPEGTCCGQAFSSKGFNNAAANMMNETIGKLWTASNDGNLPVIVDVSSCTYTFLHCREFLKEDNKKKYDRLKFLDTVDFASDVLLDKLKIKQPKDSVVLHPVCSLTKMHNAHKLTKVAKYCATNVDVPANAGCCGMAGDRGFLFPELTASATCEEVKEINNAGEYNGYYSSGKTCEMALSESLKKDYHSILKLMDDVTV